MLTLRRGLVPACFTFSVLLSALPLHAGTPDAPAVSATGAQTIVLQHVVPGDMLKLMHWDVPSKLPTGVTQIVCVPVQNALLVTATPPGFAQVRKIVKLADIEPRQVQIKFAVVSMSETELKALENKAGLVLPAAPDLKQGFTLYASGYKAARFMAMLTLMNKQAVTEEPDITTSNSVEASVTLSTAGLPAVSQQIRVTPHINPDNSLTLDLHAAFSEVAGKHAVTTLCTVNRGDTLLLVMPPAFAGDKNLLLFVTPTVK